MLCNRVASLCLASGGTGPIHPSLHGLRVYAMITSRRLRRAISTSSVISSLDAHGLCGLTRRFRVALEGVQQLLLELFNLLESFLFQVTERSSTCSSTPCGCDTTAGVPSRGDASSCLCCHGRRRAARSASPSFGRRTRRCNHIPRAGPQWGELMTIMLPPLSPIGCQDLLYLAISHGHAKI